MSHTFQPAQPSTCDSSSTPDGCSAITEEVPIDYGIHTPFIAALRAVYEEDAAALASCIDSTPHILDSVYKGWPLLHHIAMMGWSEGISIYTSKHGRTDITSEDFVTRFGGGNMHLNMCQAGGQTLLHVIALNRPSSFESMRRQYPEADIADLNGRLPEFYTSHRELPKDGQDLVLARVAQQSVIQLERQQQYEVSFDGSQPMDGVRCFELPTELCSALVSDIAQLEQRIPNSMHRYGKTLLPQMQAAVHSLVAAVLPADDLALVNHIHAFYVQYGQHVGQTSLATHADDSHWTINLCISLSPDLRGSELVFDPQNVVYTHSKAGRGIIHRGCMRHHVEPLLSGQRENVIIWVGLAPRSCSQSLSRDQADHTHA
jgi:hypothetical protein